MPNAKCICRVASSAHFNTLDNSAGFMNMGPSIRVNSIRPFFRVESTARDFNGLSTVSAGGDLLNALARRIPAAHQNDKHLDAQLEASRQVASKVPSHQGNHY